MKHYNFFVITQRKCPWCDKVKELIKEEGHDYTSIPIENFPEVRKQMKEQGYKTVPLVVLPDRFDALDFNEGTVIGGYEDTVTFFEWSTHDKTST